MPYNTWAPVREAPRTRKPPSKAAMPCKKEKGESTARSGRGPAAADDRVVCPMCKQLLSPKDASGHLLSIHCQVFAHDVEEKALAKRAVTFCAGADLADLSEASACDTEPARRANHQHLPSSSAASGREATERPALKISCKNRYKTWPGYGGAGDRRSSCGSSAELATNRSKSVSWFTPVLAKELSGSRLAKDIGVSTKRVGSVSTKEDGAGASGLKALATSIPGMPILKIPFPFQNTDVIGWRLENIFRV